MNLKHIVAAAAVAATLPTFAAEKAVVVNGEAGIVFVTDTTAKKSTLTRAEVQAMARGLKNYGEAGSPFLFDAVMLQGHSMLSRAEVRAMLAEQGVAYAMPGA